jgi:isoleucyl-tRNA synthetase
MSRDYKDTLNLPRTGFPMKANLTQKEKEILSFWENSRIYHKMQEKDRSKTYILHDGPPYANGHIHLGHTLNKILKDIIVKYKSMKGFYAPFVPGWDCHGLPIEHQVDKNLGPKKATTPVLEKRRLCREYAEKYLNIQREEFKRLGVFGDWAEPYITMSHSYEASIVREFGRIVENGYVYRGKKPVHWCPSCVTALAEAEVEYADKSSPSIYVKFMVKDTSRLTVNGSRPLYFIIWTTTPWTLPANMALALHPDFTYRLVSTADGDFIIVDDLIKKCMEETGYGERDYTITEHEWSGSELEGITCLHPWIQRDVRTILGEHVTKEQGTGIVHTAPGHGEEDYEIGLRYGLDIYAPVDHRGRFTEDVREFKGQNVFEANKGIIEILRQRGALLGEPENITHSYPHCWRCKKPVIFRATEQWFISVEKNNLREQSLEEIKRTVWIPEWGMNRIYGMVERRPDWCISRQRAWGVPITLFQCKGCKRFITDSDVIRRIEKEVERAGADVWFAKSEEELLPEGYTCPHCGSKEFSKEMDILDVWFDSGISHAAVTEKDQRLGGVADLYLEGSDQHRGWFQSSLLTSVATRGRAPYRAVLTHGFVVDGEGKKMSKSLGNVISPQQITNKHGAEILRLWCASADYREDMRISEEILSRLIEAYRKIRNTCRFLLGNIYDLDMPMTLKKDEMPEIDRFAMARLQGLIERVNRAYENFAFHEVFHSVYNFCVVDMSSFYLDVLKDRLYTFRADSMDRRISQNVLYNILVSLTKLLAPILSFTAEEIWQHIKSEIRDPKSEIEDSVFLSSFPEVNQEFLDNELQDRWERLIGIRDEVNKALEIKRKEKFIGNSLEAKVTLYVNDDIYRLLEPYNNFLPTLFIVSSAKVFKDEGLMEGIFRSSEIDGLSVLVERADGKKCERCWNWSESVGKYNDYPDVCERCHEVLTS